MNVRRCAFLAIAISGIVYATMAPGQDVAAGEHVYRTVCNGCHYNRPGKNYIGPTLFGVVGRHVGRQAGYHYSKADLEADLVFDEKTLDWYITSPRGAIPGTAMTYVGIKDAKKRADLIAYLATLR